MSDGHDGLWQHQGLLFSLHLYRTDPDDHNCPKAFKGAVEKFLKKEVLSALQSYIRGRERISDKDPYQPYEGIPDTLRNRLQAQIFKERTVITPRHRTRDTLNGTGIPETEKAYHKRKTIRLSSLMLRN